MVKKVKQNKQETSTPRGDKPVLYSPSNSKTPDSIAAISIHSLGADPYLPLMGGRGREGSFN